MKKLVISVFIGTMCLMLNSLAAVITVDSVATKESAFTVNISLKEADKALGGGITIAYDNARLELVTAELTNALLDVGGILNPHYRDDAIRVTWATLNGSLSEGEIIKLNFMRKATGAAEIKVENVKLSDVNGQNIPIDIINGGADLTTAETPKPNIKTPSYTGSGTIWRSETVDVQTEVTENKIETITVAFNDIDGFDWAEKEIMYLAEKGIVKGTSDNAFSPSSNIKRADFMLLLVRMLGLTTDFTDNFEDVSPSAYYYREIAIAKAAGLAEGVGDNKFDPEALITRQDMFTLAARAIDIDEVGDAAVLAQFSDSDKIADYAKNPLAALSTHGLIRGNESKIEPLQFATRAETAVFVYRLSVQ